MWGHPALRPTLVSWVLPGGVVAALVDTRAALLAAALVMSLAGLLLPRGDPAAQPTGA